MVNSYHQKTFYNSNIECYVKIDCSVLKFCKQNIWIRKRHIVWYRSVDLLSEKDLDNIGNDNEGDYGADKSSSDSEEMKKILKIGKKEVDELSGRTNCQHVNDFTETIFENETFRRKLIFKIRFIWYLLFLPIISYMATTKIKVLWDTNKLNSM